MGPDAHGTDVSSVHFDGWTRERLLRSPLALPHVYSSKERRVSGRAGIVSSHPLCWTHCLPGSIVAQGWESGLPSLAPFPQLTATVLLLAFAHLSLLFLAEKLERMHLSGPVSFWKFLWRTMGHFALQKHCPLAACVCALTCAPGL